MSYERKLEDSVEAGVYPLRQPKPEEPDYRALAQMCLRHRDGKGKCMEVFDRLADHLGLDPRARMRVRSLLALYGRPYITRRR